MALGDANQNNKSYTNVRWHPSVVVPKI